MTEEVKQIHEQLLLYLETDEESNQPDIHLYNEHLLMITEVIESLKQKLPCYTFDCDASEIVFFKTVLPKIISLFIYYTEKCGIENSELIGTRKSRAEYLTRLIKKIEDFSTQNAEFYDYCSLGKSNFDCYYFLRNSPLNREATILFGSVVDPQFCPVFSIKVAMISAYRTLDEELSEPRGEKKLLGSGSVAVPNGLRWTGSKRSLIELIYPLQKYVNNGQASIKEIVQGFQHLFNTDLNNYPRIYQEVLGRKKGETLFLNQLMNDMNERSVENEKERLRKRGFK